MQLQALVAFVGDCPDTELLQDVLQLTCELLHPSEPTHRPLLAALSQMGGVQLFLSLVQREQQPLRLLGLRILAAFSPLPPQTSTQLSPRAMSKLLDMRKYHQLNGFKKKHMRQSLCWSLCSVA